ncbi:serine hydrolase [Streptomyces sp. NPDC059080]|uniref:serine hydrolase n=1 Tax=Streptomyces sp. NPDC059080 TaxID=3346718 RepID=UPI003695427D
MPRSRPTRRARAAAVAVGVLLTALGAAAPALAVTGTYPSGGGRHGSAAVGGERVVCTSGTPGLAPTLSRDIAGAFQGREDTPALALYDASTQTSCRFRADTAFDTASVVKVTVLGALLRQAQEAHRPLTDREGHLATAMITRSDNAATSKLWRQVGPDGIQHFLTLAGMTHTVPGDGPSWGLTQSTADDQLTLMRLLTHDNEVLGPAARSYALGLMRDVAPDQRWGAPAGHPVDATAQVKNGWLPRTTDGWRVHSVAAFTGGGHDYSLAVLTRGNRTMDYGIATIEAASRVIHRDLGAATT